MFLYVLTTTDRDSRILCIARVCKADLEVDLLTGKSIQLKLGSREEGRLREFGKRWADYLDVRDDIIALTLQRREKEALKLETERGAAKFDEAVGVIRDLKAAIQRAAALEEAANFTLFRRAAAELAGLIAVTLGFIARLLYLKSCVLLDQAQQANRTKKEFLANAAPFFWGIHRGFHPID